MTPKNVKNAQTWQPEAAWRLYNLLSFKQLTKKKRLSGNTDRHLQWQPALQQVCFFKLNLLLLHQRVIPTFPIMQHRSLMGTMSSGFLVKKKQTLELAPSEPQETSDKCLHRLTYLKWSWSAPLMFVIFLHMKLMYEALFNLQFFHNFPL